MADGETRLYVLCTVCGHQAVLPADAARVDDPRPVKPRLRCSRCRALGCVEIRWILVVREH